MNHLQKKYADENLFFEGPQSRFKEFIFLIKISYELIKGFRKFHFLDPCATVFGSARFKEDHPYYELSKKIGGELAHLGLTVMTGGGPGLMEAANRGAKEAKGKSVGCNIVLLMEQNKNKYLDLWVEINYFFVRKILLTKYSYVFIIMPGGYGTLDEFFEILTLIQVHKIKKMPVILMGKEYHKDLMQYIDYMEEKGTISKQDKALFLFTDDVQEAVNHISKNAVIKIKKKRKPFLPLRIFGERKSI
jgi:uncharacterized protein (TIGR00730 family)